VCNTQHDTWPACTLARTRLTAPASRRTGTGCELAALGCRSRYAGLAHTHTLHSMGLDPPAAAARRQRYALGTLTPAIPCSTPTLASVAWTRDSRAVVGLLVTAECKWDYWLLQSVSGINCLLQSVSGINCLLVAWTCGSIGCSAMLAACLVHSTLSTPWCFALCRTISSSAADALRRIVADFEMLALVGRGLFAAACGRLGGHSRGGRVQTPSQAQAPSRRKA
jgi:hypothetical protein